MQSHPTDNLLTSEQGVTAIEYALIASLIAVVILGSVALVGTKTLGLWTLVSNCVEFATTGNGSCS